MGMDITGKSGNYFRANIWSWPDIVAATEMAANIKVPDLWHTNDYAGMEGVGLSAAQLADAIEATFFPHGAPTDPDIRVPVQADPTQLKGTAAMRDAILADVFELTGHDPQAAIVGPEQADHGPRAGHLWEWVMFLRECGGDFEIA